MIPSHQFIRVTTIVCAVLAFCCPFSGSAAVISYDFDISGSSLPETTVPQFSPSLGILQAVTLAASHLGGTETWVFQNTAAYPNTIGCNFGIMYGFRSAADYYYDEYGDFHADHVLYFGIGGSVTGTADPYSGQAGVFGPDCIAGTGTGDTASSITFSDGLSTYMGDGSVTLVSLGYSTSYGPLGMNWTQISDGASSSRFAKGSLSYTFVPEPGSMAMLVGIALTALLYWWRKRA